MASRQPYITLPKELVEAMGWQPGDRVSIQLGARKTLILTRVESSEKSPPQG